MAAATGKTAKTPNQAPAPRTLAANGTFRGVYRREPRDRADGAALAGQDGVADADDPVAVGRGPLGREQRLQGRDGERDEHLGRVDDEQRRRVPAEREDTDQREEVREQDRSESAGS
ncbi:hypothetical protein GJ629_07380 [Halapricum sp. CBA1109]|nr:hypothetical protein [Halapricum sp. CBA1109]MUV89739.1 hypothetical protein [Halapricum sp. CBA1109]